MNSPRKITRTLDISYINEIIELTKNINLYATSLVVDYENIFEEKDKKIINHYISRIQEYIKLLDGYKKLFIQGKCHSSIHRKFKIVAQEIFEIELLLKKYSLMVWKTQQTSINKFNNGSSYCFVVHSLLMDPNLNYIEDEQLVLEQYEKRMAMLQDSKRRFLSTSLVSNELTRLFYDSHIGAIVPLDESNYIAANYRDAATGDAMFTKTCLSKENDDDIYTVRRDELGNIYTGEPATIISTPEVIKHKQLYDERAVTVNEVILDRQKSKMEGILCYVYGNAFLSYSRKFAQELGKKNNIPVIYIDKTLYIDKNISEYELYEQFEIVKGIKQYLDEETKERVYFLSGRDFDTTHNIYIKIFELANKQCISNSEEAKIVIKNLVGQIIKQKEREVCLNEER